MALHVHIGHGHCPQKDALILNHLFQLQHFTIRGKGGVLDKLACLPVIWICSLNKYRDGDTVCVISPANCVIAMQRNAMFSNLLIVRQSKIEGVEKKLLPRRQIWTSF